MKTLFFLALTSLLLGLPSAMAQSTGARPCKTVKECQELRESLKAQLKGVDAQILVNARIPRVASTVINGAIWSNVLPGLYQNIDLDMAALPIGLDIQNSQATEACKALGDGWFLPTAHEFMFQIGDDYTIIPGLADHYFWSSSLGLSEPHGGIFLATNDYGIVYAGEHRDLKMSVICIQRH